MAFAEDLVSYFTTRPALIALVDERVYPLRLPQGPTFPAVFYQQVGGLPEHSHDSEASRNPRVQFTVCAKTYAATVDVAAQVRVAVDAWYASMIGAAFVESSIDMSDPTPAIYQVVLDVMFWGVAA